MRKTIPIAGIALSLAATAALGGTKAHFPLELDMTARYASGSLGDARAQPDGFVFHRCDTSTWAGGAIGYCVSCNVSGCIFSWSQDPEIIDAVRSLSANGHLTFHWKPSGEIESLYLQTGSHFTPVQP